jgi:hypothetical protein
MTGNSCCCPFKQFSNSTIQCVFACVCACLCICVCLNALPGIEKGSSRPYLVKYGDGCRPQSRHVRPRTEGVPIHINEDVYTVCINSKRQLNSAQVTKFPEGFCR